MDAVAKPIDTAEHGAERGGIRQTLDQRLFMQLQVFDGCRDPQKLAGEMSEHGLDGVLYADVQCPTGVAALTFHEDPSFFVGSASRLFRSGAFGALTLRSDFTMFGRTYSSGYESNLEDWLLRKPRRNVLNPDWPWAIWYPLR